MTETYPELQRSLKRLLSNCDGAHADDGQGFNKYDANFARSLNMKSNWTPGMASSAYKMLRKYKIQLLDMGIEFDTIPEPKGNSTTYNIKNATLKDNRIILEFKLPQAEWNECLSFVRSLPGRVYHGTEKVWSVPINPYILQEIKDKGFAISGEVQEEASVNEIKYNGNITRNLDEIVSISGKVPYPFQKDGIKRLNEMGGRALLADSPGLGKTNQVINYMRLNPEQRPAVIVMPASLKLNWAKELDDWLPGEPYKIIKGRQTIIRPGNENIILINYDVLADYIDILTELNIKFLAFDESHIIRNVKARWTRASKVIAKGVDHIICMSGSPIINKCSEFFTTLNMLDPKMFPNWYRFVNEFTNAEYNGFGTTYNGAKNIEKLNAILQTIMIRRLKEDVLKELPPKTITVIPMEINNRAEYEKAKTDIINYIKEIDGDEAAKKAKRAEVLVRFNRLRQLASRGKMDEAIEWIENFLNTGEKLVVFAIHHEIVDIIMNKFPGISTKLDGRDSLNKKQTAINNFQNDPNIKLFVSNIIAGGVGITLTAASTLIFLECDWRPALHSQASDRIHRIGQEAEHIDIYYLLGENTVEIEMAEIIDKKNKIITAIVDGKDMEESDLLLELIKKYKNIT